MQMRVMQMRVMQIRPMQMRVMQMRVRARPARAAHSLAPRAAKLMKLDSERELHQQRLSSREGWNRSRFHRHHLAQAEPPY